jgi:hypothetical protein
MEYGNLIRDFAQRTRENLKALRALQESQPDREVYDVTQLINSMLGLLVFPQQRYMNGIPAIPLEELAREGWPIPKVVGDYPQVQDLKQMIRYLRNAISHCNLEFVSDEEHQICGLVVWNTDPRTESTTWKAELTVKDIEKITHRFIERLLQGQMARAS